MVEEANTKISPMAECNTPHRDDPSFHEFSLTSQRIPFKHDCEGITSRNTLWTIYCLTLDQEVKELIFGVWRSQAQQAQQAQEAQQAKRPCTSN